MITDNQNKEKILPYQKIQWLIANFSFKDKKQSNMPILLRSSIYIKETKENIVYIKSHHLNSS